MHIREIAAALDNAAADAVNVAGSVYNSRGDDADADAIGAIAVRLSELAVELRTEHRGAETLRRLAAERGADTHRATVRELARTVAAHIREGKHYARPQTDNDLYAIGRFLDALADVSTPAASFELRALAREIGGR